MPGPTVAISVQSWVAHAPVAVPLAGKKLDDISKFYAPLPDDVLSDLPELKSWQEKNWLAWRSFLKLLDSPFYNRTGIPFRAWNRITPVKQLPMFPCPLPKVLLTKYDSLRKWQRDNWLLWHKICHRLGLRIAGADEYGDIAGTEDKTMEDVKHLISIETWR